MRMWLSFSLILLLLFAPTALVRAETSLRGTTLIRYEQRSLPGFEKQNIVPATQFLSLESSGIGDPNLSMHLNGWGRVDLGDKSTSKYSDGALNYGYLRYLFPQANAEVKAGRFFVFEGASTENVDGLYVKTGLAHGFAISAFGGAPVHPESSVDNRGDYITGGRFSYSAPSFLELGVSTVYEKGGMISGPLTKIHDYRQLVAGDIWLKPLAIVDLKGRLSYDTVNDGIADQSWLLALKTSTNSTLVLEYSQYEFKEYFSASSIRSLFNPDMPGSLKKTAASFSFQAAKPLELTAAYSHTEQELHGSTDRYGLQGRLNLFADKGLAGLSYFRVSAPSGINSYHEARGYLLYTAARYNASIDAIVDLYDHDINGKKAAFEIQGSAGYRLLTNLLLSCDVSYSENPTYDSELKGLVRLSFNYNSGRGAAK